MRRWFNLENLTFAVILLGATFLVFTSIDLAHEGKIGLALIATFISGGVLGSLFTSCSVSVHREGE